jgi:hypothetical protein
MQAPRFAVYMMLDEPHGTAATGGYSTAGQVAAPAAGRVISRIGPIMGLMPDIQDAPAIEQALAIPLQPPRGLALGPIRVTEPATDPAFRRPGVVSVRLPVGQSQPDPSHRTDADPANPSSRAAAPIPSTPISSTASKPGSPRPLQAEPAVVPARPATIPPTSPQAGPARGTQADRAVPPPPAAPTPVGPTQLGPVQPDLLHRTQTDPGHADPVGPLHFKGRLSDRPLVVLSSASSIAP